MTGNSNKARISSIESRDRFRHLKQQNPPYELFRNQAEGGFFEDKSDIANASKSILENDTSRFCTEVKTTLMSEMKSDKKILDNLGKF